MSLSTLARCVVCLLMILAAHSSALAQSIVVGGKNFTEQRLIAEITSQFLRAKGYATRVRTGLSTPGIRKEQEVGLLDLYWEYTGTALATFHKFTEKLEPNEAYERVKALDAPKGLIWLSPSRVNNTYALAMRRADAAAKGITSISDLASRVRQGEQFRVACTIEFYLRPDGLMPMQRAYRFGFAEQNIVRMAATDIYGALRGDASIDVGLVFSTDGRIDAFDFIVLEDDERFFPSYLLTPVIRKRALDQHPELADHLNALSAKLDNATMTALNGMVDLKKRDVEEVALSFLKASGLF
jgi:osmoprotectant transport system substrate-binding protein